MIKLHVAHDSLGYYIADEDDYDWGVGTFSNELKAGKALRQARNALADSARNADMIGGDDLGESPDY